MTTLRVPEPKTEVLREYRWTSDMFYRALDAGAFGLWPKVELIRGKIIEHPGQTPRHAYSVDMVAHRFRDTVENNFLVCEHRPVAIADDTHADTDVLIVKGGRLEYKDRHPAPEDVLLLVEAADLTMDYDLGEKAALYAESGIAEYWVVLVNDMAVVRHREPSANGYKDVIRLAGADTISPLAAPKIVWTVRTLIGREEAPKEN